MTENDWECLEMAGNDREWLCFSGDFGTTGLWDFGTSGLRDIAGDARIFFVVSWSRGLVVS